MLKSLRCRQRFEWQFIAEFSLFEYLERMHLPFQLMVFCVAGLMQSKQREVTPVRLPSKSPNLNAYAERFVSTIKRECLSQVIPLGEKHLRTVVHEFVEHYNSERPHQGLDNQFITPRTPVANDNGPIQKKQRLGGLLNDYHRGAA